MSAVDHIIWGGVGSDRMIVLGHATGERDARDRVAALAAVTPGRAGWRYALQRVAFDPASAVDVTPAPAVSTAPAPASAPTDSVPREPRARRAPAPAPDHAPGGLL